jgi:signal transduction histidine kinase
VRLRPGLLDVAWAVGATAILLVLSVFLAPPDAKAAEPLLVAVMAGLVTLGVRRWPLPVLVVLAIATVNEPVPTLIGVICMLVVLGVLAFRHSWHAAAIGWGITYGALLSTAGFAVPPQSMTEVLQALADAGLVAAPVAFGRYLRGARSAAKVAEQRLAETEAWQYAETRAARLAERSRLARDLHDIVAHHVGAMTLRASSGRLAVETSSDPALAVEALGDIADTGRHVLDELRGLLAVLRDPAAIDDEALVTEPKAAIADAVARVRGAGVPVTLDLDPGLTRSSLLVRTTAARIVQEALTNVLKHAGPGTATRLTASVAAPYALRLRIDNDPPAGQPTATAALPASGHGLAGMRDRVALLGGEFTAGPTRDGGWSVSVSLPAVPAFTEAAVAGPTVVESIQKSRA